MTTPPALPEKPWWIYLLELLMGQKTSQDLDAVTTDPGAIKGSVTGSVELPTLYDAQADEDRKRSAIVAFCRRQLGERYVFGIEVPMGAESDAWDCSEIGEHSYRDGAGMFSPDGAQNQFNYFRPVHTGKAGDLHFLWSDSRMCIGHTMIDTGHGTVIHAVKGRGVVEDPIGMWLTHPRYRGCRRHPDFARPMEDRA